MAVVDFYFGDTLVVLSPQALVILGCALFGLVAGLVTLVCLSWRRRR